MPSSPRPEPVEGHGRETPAVRLAIAAALLAGALATPAAAAGWGKAEWGMTAREIAAAYGKEAHRVAPPIEFGDSYVEIVLVNVPFAGFPFRVYFQMDKKTRRLAHVLLERRRQYATPAIFTKVVAALRERYGGESLKCDRPGDYARGMPTLIDRFWQDQGETIEASYLDFAAPVLDYTPEQYADRLNPPAQQVPMQNLFPDRRLLVRYSEAGTVPTRCP